MDSQKEKTFPVMEIFGPTVQGEGLMAGTITHFLRLGGCGLKCSWCDTMFAVDPKQVRAGRTMMTCEDIHTALKDRGHAPYVTITGGDPCLHKGLEPLINMLNRRHIEVAIETQGQLFPDWLAACDVITFSPKPPSSGNVVDYKYMISEINRMFEHSPSRRGQRICIKVVCFTQEDLEYAFDVYKAMPYTMYDSFYFTGGTPQNTPGYGVPEGEDPTHTKAEWAVNRTFDVLEGFRELSEDVIRNTELYSLNEKVHVGCQQHVLLWPEIEQGV